LTILFIHSLLNEVQIRSVVLTCQLCLGSEPDICPSKSSESS